MKNTKQEDYSRNDNGQKHKGRMSNVEQIIVDITMGRIYGTSSVNEAANNTLNNY